MMKRLKGASLFTWLIFGLNLVILSPAQAQNESPSEPMETNKTKSLSASSENYSDHTKQTPTDKGDPDLTSEISNQIALPNQTTPSTSNTILLGDADAIAGQTFSKNSELSREENSNPSNPQLLGAIAPVHQLLEIPKGNSDSEPPPIVNLAPSADREAIARVSELSEVPSSPAKSEKQQILDPAVNWAMDQVTSVSQLSDVQPTDWAFQALQSLVERYGCIAGYPDGTFRGNRALTRYEFAAGLNACLDQVNRLIAGGTSNLATKEDLLALQRLQEDFAAELATLRGRVDTLEARTAELEANQFSTTTKLTGRVEFATTRAFGDRQAVSSGQRPSEDLSDSVVLGGSVILTLNTSFTGRDSLIADLVAGSLEAFGANVTGTDMTLLDFGLKTLGGTDRNTGGLVVLGRLKYQFPIGNSAQVTIGPKGVSFADLPNINYAGTISAFGTGNPFFLFSSGGGVKVNYDINNKINVSAVYVANSIADNNFGLFNGGYGAAAELTWRPFDRSLAISAMYGHTYSPNPQVTGPTGSQFAQFPFGANTPTSADIFSLELGWDITKQFGVGLWGGYINATAESSPRRSDLNGSAGANANIWYWATGILLKDVIREGGFFGFVFGMPPKLTDNDISGRRDRDTSYHLEAYFSIPVTDDKSIYLTPGFVTIFNPEHNSANNDIWIGTIVLSFYF
ncbi:iron uptake porin [Kamptonema sp. UHCC 0994]|nr:iron uptake porin [Kamptonema sp. UHCC 0994]